MEKSFTPHPSSYRDPSGFIFKQHGTLYRQVNKVFAPHFEEFVLSGCYQHLVDKQLLIPHRAVNQNLTGDTDWHTTLEPEPIPFISYPYEWCFDMLKDAALLTLSLLKEALGFGMILKDASAYNIQWHQGKLIFIDTLSFEKYKEEEPWIAYRQFCEHFLGPLLIMHYSNKPMPQLLQAWPDGIPLPVTASLLPRRSRFSLPVYLHIHLNAGMSTRPPANRNKKIRFSKQKLLNLVSSLESLTRKLQLPAAKSTWSNYYEEAGTRENYLEEKKKLIGEWLDTIPAVKTAADLGANDGVFSKLCAGKGIPVISADFDPYCINALYLGLLKERIKNIHPLVADLSNPSPGIGVNNAERAPLTERLQTDLTLALALIHHLAIGKNIPFDMIASFFAGICKQYLIIEFVSREDEKVKLMLSQKKDIYVNYSEELFKEAFSRFFTISQQQAVGHSGRTLYLMHKHER